MSPPGERSRGARFGGMYELRLSPAAARAFQEADKPLGRKLVRCFAQLEIDPFRGNNVKPLHGPLAGRWRYRVGDYRVIYKVDAANEVINVLEIAHRRDVYG